MFYYEIDQMRVTPKGTLRLDRDCMSKKRPNPKLVKAKITDWERRLKMAQPKFKQVTNLIKKFGGILPFAMAIGYHPDYILSKWLGVTKNYKVSVGRPGVIYNYMVIMRILYAARHYGIVLKPEDFFPDLIDENNNMKSPLLYPELLEWMNLVTRRTQKMKALEDDIASLVSTLD